MPMARFQKLAVAALASLMLLIFVGAIVRVSGAGMGCPDWPTCWGCLVPPTKLEDVDFGKLEAKLPKFKAKAAQEGRDPDSITLESLRSEFNPVKAWTEYLNRLSSTPLAILTLATFIAAFGQRRKHPLVFWSAFLSLVLLLVNAWMGARIVHSGLKPGIITTHLALAMIMLGALTYCAWRGTDTPWRANVSPAGATKLRFVLGVLLLVVVAEGILGAQIREITDEMAKAHHLAPRTEWIGELEKTWLYVVHRSFSWAVLAATLWAYWLAKRNGSPGRVGNITLGIVFSQMALGVIMSQVHLYAWVQVLHVGLASVLLALVWLWLFGVSRPSERN
jgi:cytochrome c oxidase assembly protein subunit 15